MPFGVTNALAQFMFMMNDLLGEYLDKFVIVFLWRCPYLLCQPIGPCGPPSESFGETLSTPTLREGMKMWHHGEIGGIPWAANLCKRHDIYRGKVESRLRLDNPTECERYTLLPGFCKLLPTVRQELHRDRRPINIFDTKGCSVTVGTVSMACFSTIEEYVMRCASIAISRPQTPLYCSYRRVWYCSRWSVDARSGGWIVTSHIL